MRIDRFTQKMQEALQAAQDLASKQDHSEISPEHLLSALCEQPDGITPPLLEKIGASPAAIREKLASDLARRSKVQGATATVGISRELTNVLEAAEGEMAVLKDQYLSA